MKFDLLTPTQFEHILAYNYSRFFSRLLTCLGNLKKIFKLKINGRRFQLKLSTLLLQLLNLELASNSCKSLFLGTV